MEIDNINHSMHGIKGLTTQQVFASRNKFGRNELIVKRRNFWSVLQIILKEPLSILLLAAALLYFISGEINHGVFMTFTIVLVTGISLYQESRSSKALASLKALTQPICKVIRNGMTEAVNREEVVVGDVMIVEEGNTIPADGIIIHSNDFSVNESILTGESFSVSKNQNDNKEVFQGTTVSGGLAICEVKAIGANTTLGKIGGSLESIQQEDTPMQKQIGDFVKKMTLAGVVIFLIVWGINFIMSQDILKSLLKALTLAMSILPEEIPVAFTTFIALGSWRLMKLGVIVKQGKNGGNIR
jgi:Ca2+-transporting ATPase